MNAPYVRVTKDTVPSYLRTSRFLNSWDEGIGAVEVPASVLKMNNTIESDEDLLYVLTTLRYWIVEEPSMSVISYCFETRSASCDIVLKIFASCWQYIDELLQVKKSPNRWNKALETGSVLCVMWLHEHGQSSIQEQCCSIVAGMGHLACLEYLHKSGFSWDAATCSAAAKHDRYDCLKYLHESGCPWDEDTTFNCAHYGCEKCLTYALSNGCGWSDQSAYMAAAKGNVGCLVQFVMLNHGTSFLTKLSHIGAAHGQLKVLQFLRNLDCLWDHDTVILASKAGSLECLKYLHEEGLFFYGEAVPIACAVFGHVKCLQFAVECGCFISMDTYYYTSFKHKDVFVYLRQIGFWDDADVIDEEDWVDDYNIVEYSDAYWGLDMTVLTPEK